MQQTVNSQKKGDSRSSESSFMQRGGRWVLTQIFLLTSIVVSGIVWSGDWFCASDYEPRWFVVIVSLLLFTGLIFLISGLRALGRFLTIFPEPKTTCELVESGIYGVVRHPLYTSVIFCALAWSLFWNSLPALVWWGVTVIFIDAKARHEEIRLRAKFPQYASYSQRVKRLIPWIY